MIAVTYRANFSYMLRHPWQLALALLGIGVGLILGVAALLSPVLVGRKLRRVDLPLGLATGVALYLVLRPEGGEVDLGRPRARRTVAHALRAAGAV